MSSPDAPSGDGGKRRIMALKHILVKTALLVMGLTPLLEAGQQSAQAKPILCPPINTHLTATLLDVFIYPGLTGR